MTIRQWVRTIAAAASVTVLSACGGDGGTEVSSEADGTMSATVGNLGEWRADKSLVATYSNGELTLTGAEKSGRTVTINVFGLLPQAITAGEPTTVSLYGQATIQTGFAEYEEGPTNSFNTTRTGGSGTITITSLTDTRAVGTFTFTAVRTNIQPGGPGEQDIFRRLMGGQFDVRLH